jgi:hypothetical protein
MRYNGETLLIEQREGCSERIMNRIRSGSQFVSVNYAQIKKELKRRKISIPGGNVMLLPEGRELAARQLGEGWKRNGPHPNTRYFIQCEDGRREEVF